MSQMKAIKMSHAQYARQLAWTKAKAEYKVLTKLKKDIEREIKGIKLIKSPAARKARHHYNDDRDIGDLTQLSYDLDNP
jgi:hypothetical protein